MGVGVCVGGFFFVFFVFFLNLFIYFLLFYLFVVVVEKKNAALFVHCIILIFQ